jgi:hypothetical protein
VLLVFPFVYGLLDAYEVVPKLGLFLLVSSFFILEALFKCLRAFALFGQLSSEFLDRVLQAKQLISISESEYAPECVGLLAPSLA